MVWILDPPQIYNFLDVFSHSVDCLFTVLILPSKAQFVVLMKSSVSVFPSLLVPVMLSYLRMHCHIQGREDLPLFSKGVVVVPLYFDL